MGWSLGLALAYYLAARLGLATSIGPGSVTAVWPPSGLALAALMIWGPRAIAGLALGSFLVNWMGYLQPLLGPGSPALLGALALSAGSLIQSALAARLLRGVPGLLAVRPSSQTLKFAAVAALCCLVAPSIGSATLRSLGVLSSTDWIYGWLTWWVGDLAGMLVVTPPLLLWLHRAMRRDPVSSLAFPILCMGLGMTVIASFVIGHLEREARIDRFKADTRSLAQTLQTQFELAQRDLEVLQSFHYKVEISEKEFQSLADPMLLRSRWQLNFAWLPRVEQAARADFEQSLGGAHGMSIRQIDQEDRLVKAAVRDVYLPVRWTAPGSGHEALIGVDEAGDPLRIDAINRARQGTHITATPPIRSLARTVTDRVVVTLYAPIWAGVQPRRGDAGPDALRGLVSAQIDLAVLLQAAQAAQATFGADEARVLLFDVSAQGVAGMFGQGPSMRLWSRQSESAVYASLAEGVHEEVDVQVADRRWRFLAQPSWAGSMWLPSWLQAGVFLAGLAFTGLLTGFMVARRRREMGLHEAQLRLETQVAERTESLSMANVQLRAEVQERQRTEAALRSFSWFADSAAECLGFADFNRRVIYMNAALKRLVGDESWKPGMERDMLRYYDAPGQERFQQLVMPALQAQGQWSGQLTLHDPKGGPDRLMQESYFIVKDDQGQPLYFAVIITDLTERRQLEEDLRTARERADTANQAKSVFLANMSHEIRTPLNAVLGYAQLLREDAVAGSLARTRVQTILDAGQRLLRLINEVLDLSKIEAGSLDLKREAFDLSQELQDAVTLVAPHVQSKGLRLDTELALGEAAMVTGDRGKLGQVVMNLLGNALKFTDHGHVSLKAWRVGDQVHIEVRDTGPGIADAERERLFAPFAQGRAGLDKGGSGLGLVVSRHIARAMGGDLTLSGKAGAGTCAHLSVCLPERVGAVPDADRSAADLEGVRLDASTARRVLVVEDDGDSRNVLAQALQRIGCEVLEAPDGQAALDLCAKGGVDLVYTDIRMPVLDGLQMLSRLRADAATAALPVVAVSASSLAHERSHYIAQGFQDFVAKPYRFADIYRMLERHTGARWVGPAPTELAGAGGAAPAVRAAAAELDDAARITVQRLAAAAAEGDLGEVQAALAGLAPQWRSAKEGEALLRSAKSYDFEAVQAQALAWLDA